MDNSYSYPDGITPMFEDAHSPRVLAGRYSLLNKVGEGGAAEVYRARDERLDRIVAVKLLRPQFTSDQESRSRFAIEAKAAAGLSHPNIVDVYDFGETPDSSIFIVMQYVEGENLKDLLQKRGRMTAGEVITIARQVCNALTVAHNKGLIHRDVKPQNIMVDRVGNVRLTDFGVVKALAAPALTQSGMTFGTAAYLSPEQATGAPVGPASDIYALGCVMYELLAGRPPFVGDNPAVVAYKQVWEQPPPLHTLVPEVPPSLEGAVMRCLDKDPGRRYPNTGALATDLDRINASFNQPTQAVSLGSVAATSMAEPGKPSDRLPLAEKSQAIPMPVSPNAGHAVPPVRVQATQHYNNPNVPTPSPLPAPAQRPPAFMSYPKTPGNAQTLNVNRQRRSMSWLPIVLIVLLGLAICGFGALRGRDFLGAFGPTGVSLTPQPTATVVVQRPTPTALAPLGQIVQGSPITAPQTHLPTNTPPPLPTNTPIPPVSVSPTQAPLEATATSAPPPPPLPAPTDTPAPPPEVPTDTPPPPEQPTDTPVAPQGNNTITLDAADFSGGYTRSNGKYHGRTARWVYGQGTPYHTMTASFTLDRAPQSQANLTITGVDSEDAPKTPIRIEINGAVIYEGRDPLPNDNNTGPNGPGNWGTYTWQFDPGVLQQGGNTLSITNLDPSSKIGYPLFFMLDYATISY